MAQNVSIMRRLLPLLFLMLLMSRLCSAQFMTLKELLALRESINTEAFGDTLEAKGWHFYQIMKQATFRQPLWQKFESQNDEPASTCGIAFFTDKKRKPEVVYIIYTQSEYIRLKKELIDAGFQLTETPDEGQNSTQDELISWYETLNYSMQIKRSHSTSSHTGTSYTFRLSQSPTLR